MDPPVRRILDCPTPRSEGRSPCPESALTFPESMLTMAGIDPHHPGIDPHLRPESVLTLLRNQCSPWSGALTPERTGQNDIHAERDKKGWERRDDRPDPEREKQEPPVLVGRYGGQ